MRTLPLFFLMSLTACTIPGIKPLGENIYESTVKDPHSDSTPQALREKSIKEADAYCRARQQTAEILEANQEGGGYGKSPEADVEFRCIKRP